MKANERVSEQEWRCPDCGYAAAISVAVAGRSSTCKTCFERQITQLGDKPNALWSRGNERSEQAALPAVEEMAERCARLTEPWFRDTPTPELMKLDRESTLMTIVAAIAPLYAKLADLEQQLSRNQQFVADQGQAIAEYAEVLGECRSRAAFIASGIGNIDETYKRTAKETIARIDALLGEKGET